MNLIHCHFYFIAYIFVLSYCHDRISDVHTFGKKSAGMAIANRRWKLVGNAYMTDGDVVLTRDAKAQSGGIWALQPVMFPAWEVEMEFHVNSNGRQLFGDGLVLWYVDDPNARGNVFGYKDYFRGMGLFLDTYNNHNGPHTHTHPYVSLMVNDGSVHYDHDRDGTHTQAAGCEFQFRHSKNTAFIKLQYNNDTLTLWKRMSDSNYAKCFSTEGVNLPTNYFFGVTAATGDLSDEHKLISFRLIELDSEKKHSDRLNIIPKAASSQHQREHVPSKQTSRFQKFIKVMFISFLIIGAILGVVWLFGFYYQEQQRRNKRFY